LSSACRPKTYGSWTWRSDKSNAVARCSRVNYGRVVPIYYTRALMDAEVAQLATP
jgi:hypothetical protein